MDEEERYEFGRPHDRQVVLPDGGVLPTRRQLVRRQRANGEWQELGWVDLSLLRLVHPPSGHLPVSIVMSVSVNLAAVAAPWDGRERRRQRPP